MFSSNIFLLFVLYIFFPCLQNCTLTEAASMTLLLLVSLSLYQWDLSFCFCLHHFIQFLNSDLTVVVIKYTTLVFYISKKVHLFCQNFDQMHVHFCLYKKPEWIFAYQLSFLYAWPHVLSNVAFFLCWDLHDAFYNSL